MQYGQEAAQCKVISDAYMLKDTVSKQHLTKTTLLAIKKVTGRQLGQNYFPEYHLYVF